MHFIGVKLLSNFFTLHEIIDNDLFLELEEKDEAEELAVLVVLLPVSIKSNNSSSSNFVPICLCIFLQDFEIIHSSSSSSSSPLVDDRITGVEFID
nr:5873_t:CDS:2 [Entrophospora candida]